MATEQFEYAKPLRLGNPSASHMYVVECEPLAENVKGRTVTIDVEANTRTQAAAYARKAGFKVCAVNMVA